eukprot:3816344-Amphidinium_carterae.1
MCGGGKGEQAYAKRACQKVPSKPSKASCATKCTNHTVSHSPDLPTSSTDTALLYILWSLYSTGLKP